MDDTPHGLVTISHAIYDKVTQYHATIGSNVPTRKLKTLEAKLLEEARKECLSRRYEEAINIYTHALAVSEKMGSAVTDDPGGRGTLIHNIAFCLHCLGEFDAAKAYYEQSLEMFQEVKFPLAHKLVNGILYPERLIAEWVFGGLNQNRILLTKERLHDISFGRKPDMKQLDEWGRTKKMPDEAAPPPKAERPRDDEEGPAWLRASRKARHDDDAYHPYETTEETPPRSD